MKERTLRGAHQGEVLILGTLDGEIVQATIWDGMLLLARNKMPHPLVYQWRWRYIVGGRFWRPVPHAFVKNPLNLMCYEDTLMSFISSPFRPRLIQEPQIWEGRVQWFKRQWEKRKRVRWKKGYLMRLRRGLSKMGWWLWLNFPDPTPSGCLWATLIIMGIVIFGMIFWSIKASGG